MCRIAILKHITLTVLLSVTCFYVAKAQNDSVRFNIIESNYSPSVGGSILEFDGNYYLTGSGSVIVGKSSFFISKYDKTGNLIQSNSNISDFSVNAYFKTNSLIVGEKMYFIGVVSRASDSLNGALVCFDQNTDTVFQIEYNWTRWDEFWSLKKAPYSDKLYLSGQTFENGNSQMFVCILDTNGAILNFNSFGGAYMDVPLNQAFCDNGDLLFVGFQKNAGQLDYSVVRTDSLGQLKWQKKWGDQNPEILNGVFELESGNILLGGGKTLESLDKNMNVLFKMTSDGSILQETQIDTLSKFSGLTSFIKESNSEFYACSHFEISPQKYWPIFYKLDTLGNIIYSRVIEYDGDSNQYKGINDFKRTSDRGFILAGTKFSTSTEYQSAWLVKLDSLGCLVAGCDTITGIKEITLTQGEHLLLQSWPNPTNGQFFCSWPQEQNQPTGYRLMNLTGQLVDENSIPFGQNHLELNLSNESSGVYFLSLFDANRVLITKKIVKE